MLTVELFERAVEACATKEVVLFGTSQGGMNALLTYFKQVDKVKWFCDNDESKWGKPFCGIEVVSPETLVSEKDNIVVIIASMYEREITEQLNKLGITCVFTLKMFQYMNNSPNYACQDDSSQRMFVRPMANINPIRSAKIISDNYEHINSVTQWLTDDYSKEIYKRVIHKRKFDYQNYTNVFDYDLQYFPLDVLKFNANETFLDVGTYDGNTSLDFEKAVNYEFNKVYCFETSLVGYHQTIITIGKSSRNKDKYEFFNFGLFDENTTIKIDGRSGIISDGEEIAVVKRLDDVSLDYATYIKMDIEGAEQAALRGAENTIKKYKPKLAICIYHKMEDLWEIPCMIKKMVPEYKFAIRHFSQSYFDTVLFAYL